jgi:hypothetical protein
MGNKKRYEGAFKLEVVELTGQPRVAALPLCATHTPPGENRSGSGQGDRGTVENGSQVGQPIQQAGSIGIRPLS